MCIIAMAREGAWVLEITKKMKWDKHSVLSFDWRIMISNPIEKWDSRQTYGYPIEVCDENSFTAVFGHQQCDL